MTQKGHEISDRLSAKALFCMFLLSLQFGIQPTLTKHFTPSSICRSSVILVQEGIKFNIALFMLYTSGDFKKAVFNWSVPSWLKVAGIPATLYSIQNIAALMAYQNLDALTFNVLNQTKTLSAAICCYFVMGRKQSKTQILSLFILLGSALVIEKIVTVDLILSLIGLSRLDDSSLSLPENEIIKKIDSTTATNDKWSSRHFTQGVAPVLLASFISGLAGALTQKNLQSANGRNPYLFSMELCAASTLFLSFTLLTSDDGKFIYNNGFFTNWNVYTFIPIFTNACGGIIVGLVTKYAGSVRKGFALIFGLLLSGIFQIVMGVGENSKLTSSSGIGVISKEQIVGGIMAGLSLWAHATHPYIYKPAGMLSENSNGEEDSGSNATDSNTVRNNGRKGRKED